MHSCKFYAVTHESEVYCLGCLPDGVELADDTVHPIFPDSEWDYYPVCDHCSTVHDYVCLLPASFNATEIHLWFERDRQHVELRDKRTQKTIAEWWDQEVTEAVTDGFLNPRNWHKSAYECAKTCNVL